ncbi:hypothetical protein EDB19DRAFT_1835075 [Suillus lakei]|nr:hypothetical protein EDB19DRAFT_1835075 [Suillus lakei]
MGAGTIDFGDLQKGERYINMDYLFFSSMRSSHSIHVLNISYDIACQWNKNLWSHMFSFNFIKGVGQTDGKAPECGWADINPLATSTRKMGPGSRKSVLWATVDLDEFEAALDADQLAGWRTDIEMWELDRSLPNPFEVKVGATVTQAAVHLALSKTEAEEIECGEHMSLDDDVSPLVLISSGIELEDDVLGLRGRASDSMPRTLKKSRYFSTSIPSTAELIPGPAYNCCTCPVSPACNRPTTLPPRTRYEWDLHEAQANDALSNLHTIINMTYHLYKYKDAFVQGIIHSAESQIDALSVKYTAARDALVMLASKLSKNDDWRWILKPLDRTKDAVPLKHNEGKTVSQQNISWIWKMAGVSNNQEEGLQDSLRMEWCKARARAHQWEEEVLLLREEMCHVLAFFEWQAGWWDKQVQIFQRIYDFIYDRGV